MNTAKMSRFNDITTSLIYFFVLTNHYIPLFLSPCRFCFSHLEWNYSAIAIGRVCVISAKF